MSNITEKRNDKKDEIEILGKDKFGNPVSIKRKYDSWHGSRLVKVTTANWLSEFMFLGDVYSYNILFESETIKKYQGWGYYEVDLLRDIYGRLILYFEDIDSYFSSGRKEQNVFWKFVDNETEADDEGSDGRLRYVYEPYIHGTIFNDDKTWCMVAYELFTIEPIGHS